jgi:hypothetical protein
MAQPWSSGAERLRPIAAALPERLAVAVKDSAEEKLDAQRRNIDELGWQGKYTEALRLEAENVKALAKLYGNEDLRTIRPLESVSFFMLSGGPDKNGYELLESVIEVRIKVQGKNHPDTLASIASKVGNLNTAGRTLEAERFGRECLNSCRAHLTPESQASLRVMSNLESIYTLKGDLVNAEKPCLEVLKFGAGAFRMMI